MTVITPPIKAPRAMPQWNTLSGVSVLPLLPLLSDQL